MKIIISFMFFIISSIIVAQTNTDDSLHAVEVDSIEIINNNFKEIIDSLISNEKKCSYYSNNLCYGIDIYALSGDSVMCVFYVEKNPMYFLKNYPVGFFRYDSYLFIIQGKLLFGIHRKSSFRKKFQIIKGNGNSLYVANDSYTTRCYIYFNGQFNFFGGSPPCPR